MDTKSKVLVTGDFVIDHHILKGNRISHNFFKAFPLLCYLIK